MELLGKTYVDPDDSWFTAPNPPADGMRLLVSEGFCPFGHGRLEKDIVPGHGWCSTCRVGWKLEGELLHAALLTKVST